MALTSSEEAAILRELEREQTFTDGKFYGNMITRIADDLAEAFREELKKKTDGSGALASSVVAIPADEGLEIQADFYYKFIDQGVNAAPKRAGLKYLRPLQTGSPFSFKNLKVSRGMIKNLRSIVGGDISSVFAVAVSIKKHGVKSKGITEAVITDALLDKISEDLADVTGLALEVIWDNTLNKDTL